jgi:hypothetical protein
MTGIRSFCLIQSFNLVEPRILDRRAVAGVLVGIRVLARVLKIVVLVGLLYGNGVTFDYKPRAGKDTGWGFETTSLASSVSLRLRGMN